MAGFGAEFEAANAVTEPSAGIAIAETGESEHSPLTSPGKGVMES